MAKYKPPTAPEPTDSVPCPRSLTEWREWVRNLDCYRLILFASPSDPTEETQKRTIIRLILEQVIPARRRARSVMRRLFGMDVSKPRVVDPNLLPARDDEEGQVAFALAMVNACTWEAAANAVQESYDEDGRGLSDAERDERAAKAAFRVWSRAPAGYQALIKSGKSAEFAATDAMRTEAVTALAAFVTTQISLNGNNFRLRRALLASKKAPKAVLFARLIEQLPQALIETCFEAPVDGNVWPSAKELGCTNKGKRSRSLVSRTVRNIERQNALTPTYIEFEHIDEQAGIGEFTAKEIAHKKTKRADIVGDDEILRIAENLSKRQKEVVRLYYYEGMCCEKVSELLGISVSSVKTHLSRARAGMKRARAVR